MKNPMTPEEMCQAVMDNAAGHNMQFRLLNVIEHDWTDLHTHDGLDLKRCEYRRKPALIELFVNMYKDKEIGPAYKTRAEAIGNRFDDCVRTIRLVEDPTETEPEEMPDTITIPYFHNKNPWRPIIKGAWPECDPRKRIVLKWKNGSKVVYIAGQVSWNDTSAIEWKFAKEDE